MPSLFRCISTKQPDFRGHIRIKVSKSAEAHAMNMEPAISSHTLAIIKEAAMGINPMNTNGAIKPSRKGIKRIGCWQPITGVNEFQRIPTRNSSIGYRLRPCHTKK